MGRLGHIVLGGEAGGCSSKGKTEKKKEKKKGELIMSYIKRETVSLSPPCSLMRSRGSLLVSSHASIMNAAPLPPPLWRRIIWFIYFFLTASSYQVKRAELYLYDEKPSDYIVSTFLEVCAFRKATHGVFGVGAERSGLIDCHWSV